ncbi:MAG: PAS domain S-box protein [Anaerolineae bacterium]|nr:PAS domain S-box protein [Anaerolineae bacterium]
MGNEPLTILAIDDNPDNLLTIKVLVGEAFPRAAVLTAASGEEGLRLAAARAVDLVLLDVVMPGMDGFAVCREIKTNPRTSDIPVVFLTALKGDSDNRVRALEAGGDAFLAKPVDAAELTAQIRTMSRIRRINVQERLEREDLARMVREQTRELEQTHVATLNLLEDLQAENEARRRNQEALRESEERYRTVIASATEAVIFQDRSGALLTWNGAAERIFGLTEAEALGQTSTSRDWKTYREDGSYLPGAEHPSMVTLATGQPCRDEIMRVVRADGSESWISVNTNPVYWSGSDLPDAVVITIHDITARRQAEEALQERERELATLMANLPGMAYRCRNDQDWTMQFVSQGCLALTGYLPEDLVENRSVAYIRLIHPDDRAMVWQAIQAAITANQPYEFEYRITNARGQERWVWERGRLAEQPAEGQMILEGFISDITERKRMETILRDSENRFRLLYEQSPGPYQSLDAAGIILEVNRAWLAELGYTADEVVGHWFGEFLPEEGQSAFRERFKRFKSLGEVHGVEYEMCCKDGSRIIVSFDGRIARDVNNDFVRTHCVFTNITERKRGEALLRQYADDLNHAQSVAHVGSWKWHIPSNTLEWSDQMYVIFGIEKDTFSGDLADVIARAIHPDDRAMVEASNRSVAENGRPIPLEYRVVHPDGIIRTVWAEAGELVADAQGNPVALTGIVQDITERKRMEQSLRDQQQLLDRIYDLLPVGLWFADKDGMLLRGNPAGVKIWGAEPRVRPADYGVFKARRLPGGEEIEPADWALARSIREGTTITGEVLEIDAFDGETRVIINSTAPVVDEDGKIQGAIVLNQDITEQYHAQQHLRESEEKFALAFQNSPYGIAITHPQSGQFVDVNPAMETISGYSREELLDNSSIALHIWEQDADREVVLERLFSGESIAGEEYHFRRKDGSRLIAILAMDIIQISHQPYILSVINDITEARAAQAQLLLQDTALDAAANGIVITDIDANITWCNPAFCAMTGYSQAEVLGSNPRELVKSGMQSAEFYQEMWETILAGQVWRGEFINRRKDGTLYTEQEIITPIQAGDGTITHFIAIKEDITLRKQQEQQLLRHSHIQERLVAMGRALSSVIDVNLIYRIAHRYVREMINTSGFGIILYDAINQKLQPVYVVADGEVINNALIPEFPYTPENPYADRSRVIESQTAIITEDLLERAKKGGGGVVYGDAERPPQSSVLVPMVAEGRSLGVLELQHRESGVFTAETIEWLSVVANQVGLAIQNARLYEQIRRRVAQLSGLREIDTAINGHLPLAGIFDLVLNQARYHLNADAADILLTDPVTNELVYQAGYGFTQVDPARLHFSAGQGLAGSVLATGKMIAHYGPDENDAMLARCEKWVREGFHSYVGVPVEVDNRAVGVLEIFSRKSLAANPEWQQYLETLAGQAAIAIENANLINNLQETAEEVLQAYDATIEGWSRAMDLRDRETEGHTQRVTELTVKLARALNLPESAILHIRRGGLLHDIGKLGVPDSILLKPGKLDADEWALMKQHPQMAYEMLHQVDYLAPALDIPHYHHEKWDGSGYPDGLRGEEIPLSARIFALADVWDAVTNDRPYHAAWTRDEALAHLRAQSGTHFDPELVEVFIGILNAEREQNE